MKSYPYTASASSSFFSSINKNRKPLKWHMLLGLIWPWLWALCPLLTFPRWILAYPNVLLGSRSQHASSPERTQWLKSPADFPEWNQIPHKRWTRIESLKTSGYGQMTVKAVQYPRPLPHTTVASKPDVRCKCKAKY